MLPYPCRLPDRAPEDVFLSLTGHAAEDAGSENVDAEAIGAAGAAGAGRNR